MNTWCLGDWVSHVEQIRSLPTRLHKNERRMDQRPQNANWNTESASRPLTSLQGGDIGKDFINRNPFAQKREPTRENPLNGKSSVKKRKSPAKQRVCGNWEDVCQLHTSRGWLSRIYKELKQQESEQTNIPIHKRAVDQNREFSKEVVKMVKYYLKMAFSMLSI